jgi:hypothetical protein
MDVEVVKIANQFFVREGVRMLEEYFFNGNKNEFKSTGKAFFPVKHIYLMVKNTGLCLFCCVECSLPPDIQVFWEVRHSRFACCRVFSL